MALFATTTTSMVSSPRFLPKRVPRSTAPSSFRPPPATLPSPTPCPSSSLHSANPLLSISNSSRVLTVLVAQLDWPDLLSLLNTCKDGRNIFRTHDFRNIVLARFVPGYADALRFRELANYHDVPISLHDLDLFLISQRLPLHRYPTHALRILTASYPTLEDHYITTKLTALSQAHSRFVLLLQALVHSSTASMPLEPRDIPRRSRRVPSPHSPSHQLTFPAPLSYLRDQQQQQQPRQPHHTPAAPPALSKRSKHHSLPVKLKTTDDPLLPHPFRITHVIRPSADSLSSMIPINNNIDPFGEPGTPKHVRRRSLFKHSSITPPPPEEPRVLRFYSSVWRKGTTWNGINTSAGHQPSWDCSSSSAYVSEYGELERPHRRFASINVSSDSSISGSPATSTSPLPRTGQSSSSSSTPSTPPPMSTCLPLPIRMTSPHDLGLSISRVRAPILRVFVPCTKMEVDSESVLLCEKYLIKAGLWEHLSVGDIVCNLGYIPPTSDDGSLDTTEEDGGWGISSPPRLGCGSGGNGGGNNSKWLLFNGQYLEPYSPPGLLPIDSPISLPSPFYYAHIMPPTSVSGHNRNFRFLIERFPPVIDEIPQLALANVARQVRSTKSVNGWLEVRKWAWTARVVRHRQPLGEVLVPEEIGNGWLGEWVLEGEGTSEGRQMLLDVLAGRTLPVGAREWELVRDRSGDGRIWLRLVI